MLQKEDKIMKPLVKTVQNLVSKNGADLLLVGGVSCIIGGGIWAIKKYI